MTMSAGTSIESFLRLGPASVISTLLVDSAVAVSAMESGSGSSFWVLKKTLGIAAERGQS